MKTILEKFSKPILIEFIRENVTPFRFKDGKDLEGQLLYIQWDCETKVAMVEMDAACAAMTAADKDTPEGQTEWFAAQKSWGKANKLYNKAVRLLEKSNQLRGR
jgi:hypothetical protein